MNILVTGIAGDIGNSMGRVLRSWPVVTGLYGCDIHDEHLGHRVFDVCERVPRADAPDYLDALARLAQRWKLDAIVPSSEPELRQIHALAIQGRLPALPFVMATPKAMAVGFDKLATAQFIAGLRLPAPWTMPVMQGDPPDLPCILKSRYGAGSRGVYVVRDSAELPHYRALFSQGIWQEWMPDDASEYTCGVYGCADGEVRAVVFRRRLVGGMTGYAELVHDDAIDLLCTRLATALELRGSINVQLRLGPRGPMVFEINPRFSSTVAFRHKLGFSDLVWSIEEQILGRATGYRPSHPTGTKLYRAFDEVIE